jgi:phage tail protein X
MNNQQSNLSNEQQAALYSYLTVNQFCEKHKAFKVGGVRAQIFNAENNGLAESGAIIRDGRKVLINEPRWFARLEAQSQGGK